MTKSNADENADKLEFSYMGMQNAKNFPTKEANLQFITKIKHATTIPPSNAIPKGNENLFPHKGLYVNGYSNVFLNGQKLETSQRLSLGEQINRLWYIHTTDYYLLHSKNEQITDRHNNMEDSQMYYVN